MLNPSKQRLLALTLGFAALDQLSKWLAQAALSPGGSLAIIPGVFQLTLAYNTGAAFSMFERQPQMLSVITALIFGVLLIYGLSRPRFSRGELPAMALILGGALGNLLDRFVAGRVTDYFDFVLIHYPVFNVADSLIFIGVILLMTAQLRAQPDSIPDERPR